MLEVKMEDGDVVCVTGNTCKRGEVYGRKEVTAPTRILTTVVPVMGGEFEVVSVKTNSDIPKEKVYLCMEMVKDIVVKAPIEIGDIIKENIANTGVNLVATRSVGIR